MIVYLPILITVLCIVVLYTVPEFRKKVAWWEASVMLALNVAILIGSKAICEYAYTSDTEYLVDNIAEVIHHEYWNEWVYETCEDCSTDSKGNTTCVSYDCSYEDEHSPYTEIITITGHRDIIYEGYYPNRDGYPKQYFELMSKFRCPETILDTHKSDLNTNYGKNYQGEIKRIIWDHTFDNSQYCVWTNRYENRVQRSNSIESYMAVDTSDIRIYGLYEYPEIYDHYKQKSIIGYDSPLLDEYINKHNASIGYSKQLKIFFLVFYDKSEQAAFMQQRHWGGGNKNEANVCIGVDSRTNTIQWSYVFSWSKQENFKIEIRDYINSKTNLSETFKDIIDFSVKNLNDNFIRREFAEFSYLTVTPPTWAIIVSFIVTLIISIGGSIWIVTNKFN